MKLKPINDNICIKPERIVNQTASGIVFVNTEDMKPVRGTIVGVSDSISYLKEGDVVLYIKNAGAKVKIDGEEILILNKEKIVGKVNQ